jgi:hypothetical protein
MELHNRREQRRRGVLGRPVRRVVTATLGLTGTAIEFDVTKVAVESLFRSRVVFRRAQTEDVSRAVTTSAV